MRRIRCVLDLQGAQGESAFRGIGRYSLNFARAMARTAGEHEVWIALSGLFPETAASLRADFGSIIPQERIVTFNAPGPVAELDPANAWRRGAAERIREHFLAQLDPDIVHTCSMVEGFVDDCVTSVGVQNSLFAATASFYDIIPLIFPEQYLFNPVVTNHYLRKLQSLKRADLLLAISESSRREAIDRLLIPEDRVVVTRVGIEEEFRPISLSPGQKSALLSEYGITGDFIMYSGATDFRKNIDRLVDALALLPPRLQKSLQLLIVGKTDPGSAHHLRELGRKHGLRADAIVFSGFVTNETLIALYNTCSVFAMPSLHEGFGLPALEAMACGAPVIASNVTSLPEVVGREEALFDPYQVEAIAKKIDLVLTDYGYRNRLSEDGLEQAKKFTWDGAATVAWRSFEELKAKREFANGSSWRSVEVPERKPRLAYFSPLPPERSGIASYSAELLPDLARYYEIEVVVDQRTVSDQWINANFPVRSAAYFERHAPEYQRIVYQMGNSPFHIYMLDLLRRYPGVVVLHDFFLSGMYRWMSLNGDPKVLSQKIFESHGYLGLLQEREFGQDWAVSNLPCNRAIIEAAAGVIVHSQYSCDAADAQYGFGMSRHWRRIPQLRTLQSGDRGGARARLGISVTDYVVCSFGLVDATKLHHRLLSGWFGSPLARNQECHLVFVGENNGADYGRQLVDRIDKEGAGRVRITGYASQEIYRDYLVAADSAVQLRTMSRGETSRALLDCLGYGLPVVLNAHATMAEVPDEVVYKLPDLFTDEQLSEALEQLYINGGLRQQLADVSREFVARELHPARIAEQYRDAIESFANEHPVSIEQRLLTNLATMSSTTTPSHNDLIAAARAISMNRRNGPRQLMLDVSATAKNDLKTGVERVARNLCRELIRSPGEWKVEPIRIHEGQRLYARKFGLQLVSAQLELEEPAIEYRTGDFYLALDWCPETVLCDRQFFSNLRALDIPIYFLIHDVLPLLRPEKFPDWAVEDFRKWFVSLCEFSDGLMCVSRSVADGILEWLEAEQPRRVRPLKVGYSYSGADVLDMLPSEASDGQELPRDASAALKAMKSWPSLLMVGTLEPRKGHLQVLDAFEQLWGEGAQVNLVIIGREGWHVDSLTNRLKSNRRSGTQLFWLDAADDRVLSACYHTASGLLAPSEAEGFGLPLIEAARYGLPILARDIPVFREVAGDHAYYFTGTEPEGLVRAIRSWLDLLKKGNVPQSKDLKWLTWPESARNLMNLITTGRFYREWIPNGSRAKRARPNVEMVVS